MAALLQHAKPSCAARSARWGTASSLPLGYTPPLAFSSIETTAAFHALEGDWRALFDRSGTGAQLFQQFDWLAHWADLYLNEGSTLRLHIVVGRSNGRLVLVWPLIWRRRLGVTTLSWMGFPASQYGDVLVEQHRDRDAWLLAAWEHLLATEGVDAIVLRKLRFNSPVARLLVDRRVEPHTVTPAPFIDLRDYPSAEAFGARLSAKTRRERRRQRRILGGSGDIELQVCAAGPKASAAVTDALAFKRAWLARRGLASAAFADERLERFFIAVASESRASAGCCVSILRAGDTTAAVEIGFRCKDRHIAHVGAFNPEFERCGAGTLQCEDTIERCIEDGIQAYDLLAPADDYKLALTDKAVDVCSYAYGLTPQGKLYAEMLRRGLRRYAKQGFQSLPERLRKTIAPFFGSGVAAANELPILAIL